MLETIVSIGSSLTQCLGMQYNVSLSNNLRTGSFLTFGRIDYKWIEVSYTALYIT